jgi:DNA-binding NtrC family response regulator
MSPSASQEKWLRQPRVSFRTEVQPYVEDGRGLREILADTERTMLVEPPERFGGLQVAAAKKLAIPRQTLRNRLKTDGLRPARRAGQVRAESVVTAGGTARYGPLRSARPG